MRFPKPLSHSLVLHSVSCDRKSQECKEVLKTGFCGTVTLWIAYCPIFYPALWVVFIREKSEIELLFR